MSSSLLSPAVSSLESPYTHSESQEAQPYCMHTHELLSIMLHTMSDTIPEMKGYHGIVVIPESVLTVPMVSSL